MVIVCNIVKWEMVLNFKCTRKLKTIVTKKKKLHCKWENYSSNLFNALTMLKDEYPLQLHQSN